MDFGQPGSGDWLSELLKVIGLPNYQYQDTLMLPSPDARESLARRVQGGDTTFFPQGSPQFQAGSGAARISPDALLNMFARDNAAPPPMDPGQAQQLSSQMLAGRGNFPGVGGPPVSQGPGASPQQTNFPAFSALSRILQGLG